MREEPRLQKLSGKVAVVTGSTRGLGRAIAEAFASEGATVVINSRDQAMAAKTAGDVGCGAIGIGADMSTESGINGLFAAVQRNFNRVDVLVNNAGMPMIRESIDLTLDEWRRTLDLNLTGPLLCSQHAARSMLAGAGGNIINITSIAAFSPLPRRLAYAVTKASLVMMTKIMAAEWAPKVRVNAVAPGFIKTNLLLRLQQEGKLDFKRLEAHTPQLRLGAPEDVAKACVFLASDDAGFITGETLVTDGGWMAAGFI